MTSFSVKNIIKHLVDIVRLFDVNGKRKIQINIDKYNANKMQ